MANRGMSAGFQSVEDAEKVIQSYAYGSELDAAIEYLQNNDPDNKVLATIKDFEKDRPMLKALNALYRADQAREANDSAELEKIAKYLSVSENKELRDEAVKIMSELPEVQEKPEKISFIEDTLDVAGKPKELPVEEDTMSDDEIVKNADEIAKMLGDRDFQQHIADEAVKPAQAKITIIDDDGKEVDEETSDNLWIAKMMSALQEVSLHRMDDAEFAAKDKDSKVKQLQEDVVDVFWTDLYGMVKASATDPNADEKTNMENGDKALKDFNQGKPVKIKADDFVNNAVATGEKIKDKAVRFAKEGKEKSINWLKSAYNKFNKFLNDYVGTKAEVKQAAIGYFSTARGITNTAATLGIIGATAVSVPVALAAAATYGIYQSQSWRWNILEKRNANLKLAKSTGQDTKVWEGRAGLKHAYNAIMASPREKARFDRQKRINLRAGLGSAAIVALASPVVLTGGLAALGLGAAATYGVTRLLSSGARVAGANTNAYYQMKEAKQQDKEDQTEESAKGAKRAKGAFWLSLAASGLAEYLMASSVADAVAADHALDTEHNPGNVGQQDHLTNTQDQPAVTNDEPQAEVAPETPAYDWHTQLQEELTPKQYEDVMSKFTGIFKDRADIFGMENKDQALTLDNVCNNIAKAQADGTLPSDTSVGMTLYKYMKLVENTERAEVVPGTHYLRSVLDADKQPMYWVDQEQMRALNTIILCGGKVEVSAEALGKSLARIADNGQYIGEGANVGVTHNRFVGFGRGEDCPEGTNNVNAWERVKGIVKRIKPQPIVEEPTVITEVPPQQDAEITTGTTITDQAIQDGQADDGATVGTKYQKGATDTHEGQLETDKRSIARNRDQGQGMVPGATNLGREM